MIGEFPWLGFLLVSELIVCSACRNIDLVLCWKNWPKSMFIKGLSETSQVLWKMLIRHYVGRSLCGNQVPSLSYSPGQNTRGQQHPLIGEMCVCPKPSMVAIRKLGRSQSLTTVQPHCWWNVPDCIHGKKICGEINEKTTLKLEQLKMTLSFLRYRLRQWGWIKTRTWQNEVATRVYSCFS